MILSKKTEACKKKALQTSSQKSKYFKKMKLLFSNLSFPGAGLG